jgi:hypothetical protein
MMKSKENTVIAFLLFRKTARQLRARRRFAGRLNSASQLIVQHGKFSVKMTSQECDDVNSQAEMFPFRWKNFNSNPKT